MNLRNCWHSWDLWVRRGNPGKYGLVPGRGTQSVRSPGPQKTLSGWALSIFFGCSHLVSGFFLSLSAALSNLSLSLLGLGGGRLPLVSERLPIRVVTTDVLTRRVVPVDMSATVMANIWDIIISPYPDESTRGTDQLTKRVVGICVREISRRIGGWPTLAGKV